MKRTTPRILFNEERLTFTETIILLSLFCGFTFFLVWFRDGFVFALTLMTIQSLIIIGIWILKNTKGAKRFIYSLYERDHVI